MLTLRSPPFPFVSSSLSHPHIYVLCVSGPADLNLMSKCAPCLVTPCQNNGTCVSDVTGSYRCTCPFGYKVSEHPPPNIQHILIYVCTEYSYEICASLHAREPHHPSSCAELVVSDIS